MQKQIERPTDEEVAEAMEKILEDQRERSWFGRAYWDRHHRETRRKFRWLYE